MNILIPHQWLLEHLDTQASPEDIQKIVSLSGPSVERIYDREGDTVYDIEVTTNRVDAMSVRGIAREAAVILNHAGVTSRLKDLQIHTKPPTTNNQQLPRIVINEALTPRIMCVVLSNVKRNPTPDWMAKRLQQVEMNVHDAVIDITNYITHELGHACHAFDYDKIMALGGMIIVKEAEAGKKFTTLDGEEYETLGGEIVFENESGEIIDLPGIKGTANTAIDDNTTNVLFWLESVNAKKIRFASMSHAIRTTAAQLNEKKVDPELMPLVLQRGIELYQQLTDAQVASEIVDMYPSPKPQQTVEISLSRISDYLGIELPVDEITAILEELECKVETQNLVSLQVTPPSFRPDLAIPADIIEEIARIYGYHNLPSKLMDTAIPLRRQAGVNFDLEDRIKHFLANIGWQEVYTYSMVSEELAKQSGATLEEHVTIQNPLTDDRIYLRHSLIPSLQEVIRNNPTEKSVSVFELANVYAKSEETEDLVSLPTEQFTLSLVSTKDYRQVKGDLEALLEELFITNYHFQPVEEVPAMASQMAYIKVGDQTLGQIMVLHNGQIGITVPVKQLTQHAQSHPTYYPAPKTAQIIEDLTFTLPEQTLVGEVLSAIKAVNPLVYKVELKDIYQQNFTFTVIYLDLQQNLTKEDVEPLRKEITRRLEEQFEAKLVG